MDGCRETTMNDLNLNVCPFCKIAPTELEFCHGEVIYSETEWADTYAVCCTNRQCEAIGGHALTKELAIDVWNMV